MTSRQSGTVTVRIVLSNPKAVRALAFVGEVLAELEDDFGYREDVQRACKAWRYAAKHLIAEGEADEIGVE